MFALAAVLAAALVGGLMGAVGSLLGQHGPPASLALLPAVLAAAYGASEVRGGNLWTPRRHWQVPGRWGAHGRIAYAAEFGVVLGVGFLTYVPFAGYYVVLAAALAIGEVGASSLVVAAYGLARALPVLMAATRMRDKGALRWGVLLSDRLHATSKRLWWVRASALLLVASAFLLQLNNRI